jgi:hypothetical protein
MVLGLWFESVRVMFPFFYYFKRASRSHAKTGFFQCFFGVFFQVVFGRAFFSFFCGFGRF